MQGGTDAVWRFRNTLPAHTICAVRVQVQVQAELELSITCISDPNLTGGLKEDHVFSFPNVGEARVR
jgi:hypothetical protein